MNINMPHGISDIYFYDENKSHKLLIIVCCIADNRLSNSIPFGLSDTI